MMMTEETAKRKEWHDKHFPKDPGIELCDIFRQYWESYKKTHSVPYEQQKVIDAIIRCRTEALGYHVYHCEDCGHEWIFYNSCRNRHCPKCQTLAKEEWLMERKNELLPVKYYHVIFAPPHELNPITMMNQKVIYNILFKAASETLIVLGKDKKYLGAQAGFMLTLHTWGQTLSYHIHLHCIIPGGGLSDDGRWIKSKKEDFFLPVHVISSLFRGKFMAFLNEAYENGELKFAGETAYLANPLAFKDLKNELYKKNWNTFIKDSVDGERVVDYLGRYVYRVAISNSRLIKIEDGRVHFSYKDYSDEGKEKEMALEADEFIRRYLLHILPSGFTKIRYYGFLSTRNRSKLKKCQELLGVTKEKSEKDKVLTEFILCPKCGKNHVVLVRSVPPVSQEKSCTPASFEFGKDNVPANSAFG